jgi:hypothetical protein
MICGADVDSWVIATLLSWMVLRTHSSSANEIEDLVVRHQLTPLPRRTPRPRIRRTDRAVIAALGPAAASKSSPQTAGHTITILRWHRQLPTRRSTTGCPARGLASRPRSGDADPVPAIPENSGCCS